MAEIFDTILLLALPASGKSEVRKYLASLDSKKCAQEFHIGPNVQLDDFPYVHMMRQIDNALREMDKHAIFFEADDKPFQNPKDWGTLIHLVNEDYDDLLNQRNINVDSAGEWLLNRFDAARRKVGAPIVLRSLAEGIRRHVRESIEDEAQVMLNEKLNNYPDSLDGKTVVIEFARGGPHDSKMPLPAPYGYAYALSQLSRNLLERSVILYIWVTPEESRRKNQDRADPNDPGSILHHGVPIDVMMHDYGCDDLSYLLEQSDEPDTIILRLQGKSYHLPVGCFDNRVDKTSFIRHEQSKWPPEQVKALHEGLQATLEKLYQTLNR